MYGAIHDIMCGDTPREITPPGNYPLIRRVRSMGYSASVALPMALYKYVYDYDYDD